MKTPMMNYNILENTKKTFFVEVGTKKYPLFITDTDYFDEKDGKIVYVQCEGANINQEYLESDLYLLFSDIAEMIKNEQGQRKTDHIGIRVNAENLAKIDENAKKYGFKSRSEYMVGLALEPEKFLQNH